LDSNDSVKLTDSVMTTSSGKAKYAIDLDGFSSGYTELLFLQQIFKIQLNFQLV